MKSIGSRLGYGLLVVGLAAAASSCGGGGGGADGGSAPGFISFSASELTFKAVGPYAQTPAAQTIAGTVTGVTSGTLYVTIVENDPDNLFTVSNMTIANGSGHVSVTPVAPAGLQAGNFQGSITVSVCLNDPSCQTGQLSGSPRTIPVYYDIASGVDGNTVTPRVVAADVAGSVILRGSGFTGATSVSFGSVAAASMTVVSDSQIDASYPQLPSGTYPVTVDSGSISYTATLVAVAATAFTAVNIPYPSAVVVGTSQPPEIEYDAERTALFIVIPGGAFANSTLLRYAFDGGAWEAPTQLSMAGLVDVHFSPDGTHLLALVAPSQGQTSMVELDPVTMTQTNVTTAADPGAADTAAGFALANDGNAIVNLAIDSGFVFGTFSRVFTETSNTAGGCCTTPIASGNGSIVAMHGGIFVAATETITAGGPFTQAGDAGDFAGDMFFVLGAVENQAGQVLGNINGSLAAVFNSADTRIYGLGYVPGTGELALATYDLTATPTGNPAQFPELGTPIVLSGCAAGCPEGAYDLAVTPDGGTVFVAGPTGLFVQPIS